MTPVVHVLRSFRRGGAELQLLALLRHLDRARFPQTVIALEPGGPLAADYARLCPIAEIGGPRATRLFRLGRALAARRPAVLHTWLARLWGTAAALALDLPVVASFRGVDDDEAAWRVRLKRAFDRLAAQRVPIVAVANSHAVAAFVPAFTGIPARRTVVIGNMLERTELFALAPARPDGPFTVGVVARLEPVKDHATFLRAAARLAARRPEARFLLAGDGSLREPLLAQARAAGIDDRCQFLGHVGDVAQVLGRCHAAVLSSVTEGMPNAVLEALAAAVPVVATATQGSREVVREGQNGFVVPIGDDAALADRLLRLAGDPALRLRLGAEGRRDALALGAPGRIARRYERLYRVLGRPRPPWFRGGAARCRSALGWEKAS